ncbi:MAG: hypothetical protein WC001_05120 [Desulfurivibrionaceae bacterium]
MDTPNSEESDSKGLELLVTDLARQLRVEPEAIRPLLQHAYRKLKAEAVVKDFISIFAMRLVRDRFSGEIPRESGHFG